MVIFHSHVSLQEGSWWEQQLPNLQAPPNQPEVTDRLLGDWKGDDDMDTAMTLINGP